jgi:hypothetical protein
MPPSPTREDTWLITASVDGRDLGVFDTSSGGELDSEESKYKPGGMAGEISLGGTRTYGNLTRPRYCEIDSTGGDAAMISLEFTIDGVA